MVKEGGGDCSDHVGEEGGGCGGEETVVVVKKEPPEVQVSRCR